MRKIVPAVALAAATLTGVAIGGTMVGTANAATFSPGTSTTLGTTGKWRSSTVPAHEAGESAARRAAEAQADTTGVAPPETSRDSTAG